MKTQAFSKFSSVFPRKEKKRESNSLRGWLGSNDASVGNMKLRSRDTVAGYGMTKLNILNIRLNSVANVNHGENGRKIFGLRYESAIISDHQSVADNVGVVGSRVGLIGSRVGVGRVLLLTIEIVGVY